MADQFEQKLEEIFKSLPKKAVFVSGKENVWLKVQNHIRQARVSAKETDKRRVIPVFHLGRLATVMLAVVIAVGLVGSASLASEGSLPGDTLYSVKKASEKVEKIFATSEESKVKVGVKHAERRLLEVQALVAEKKAEPEVVAQTLEDLKSATEQIIQTASEVNPELRFHVADLLTKEREILDSVKAEAEGELKAKVEEAITVSQESQAKFQASNPEGAVEGSATAVEPSADEATSAKTAVPQVKNGVLQSDTQIHDVIKLGDNGEPQAEPEVLPEPTVGF